MAAPEATRARPTAKRRHPTFVGLYSPTKHLVEDGVQRSAVHHLSFDASCLTRRPFRQDISGIVIAGLSEEQAILFHNVDESMFLRDPS